MNKCCRIERRTKKITLRGSNKAWNESRYVLAILHVNILSTIDPFSVLLTSFFKQGNTAFRFDGIIANNREEKKSLQVVCANLFPYNLHHVWVVGSRQAATVISLKFAELDCDWSIHN